MGYKSDIQKADRGIESVGFPGVILIDNTSICNLRCSMCDHVNIKKYRKMENMSHELYTKIIDEIAVENPNARVWQIFYGDPFILKEMPERIKYAKDKGLTDVVLNTNGVLMTADKAEAVIKAGLDAIYVGIDAATEETYNQIRVGGDFNKAVNNVLKYRDLLAEHGNPNQKIFVQYVVSDINDSETEMFREFWQKEGVNVKVRPRVSWAGLIEAKNLQPNENVNRKPCYWLMRTINICTDGRIAFCSADPHCRVACGDIKTQTIKEAWAGQLKVYRDMHKECRFNELPEMCRECKDWQSAYAEYELAK